MKKILKYTLIFTSLFAIISCERETFENGEGPSLPDLYSDFAIVEPLNFSQKAANFTAGETIDMKASFSKPVKWEARIRGLESGAEKVISGMSNTLDGTNASWNGTTTNLPIFRTEKCLLSLYIEDEILEVDTFLTDTLEVTGTKTNTGLLIEDFESANSASRWNIFSQSGANMTFFVSDDTTAGQGDFYFDWGGTVTFDFLLGLIDFRAGVLGSPTFDITSDNPDEVYLNMMVYNPPGITNAFYVIQFQEDDNEDGSFDEDNEDAYQIEISTSQIVEGWQLLSVKLGDIEMEDPKGNGVMEPQKLRQFSLLCLADPASGFAQNYIDYIMFTEGGPLEP